MRSFVSHGRRLMVTAVALVLLAAMSVVPALAHGGPVETSTVTFKDLADVFPEVDPCTGSTGTVSVVQNGVLHMTAHPD